MAELVASGVKAVRVVYADGGQNPVFAGYKDESDPDALASGPQEIVLNDQPKPVPAAVKIAAADAAKQRAASAALASIQAPAAEPAAATVALASAPAEPSGGVLGGLSGGAQNVRKWLHLGGQEPAPPPVEAYVPDQPIPSDVPLPPRRDETVSDAESPERVASLHAPPTPPVRSPDPSSPTRRRRRLRCPRRRPRNSGGVIGRSLRSRIPDPDREAGNEARRLPSVGERARRHDDRDAVAQPHVDKAAGVFGLFTV